MEILLNKVHMNNFLKKEKVDFIINYIIVNSKIVLMKLNNMLFCAKILIKNVYKR